MNDTVAESIAKIVCNKPEGITCEECFSKSSGKICENYGHCRILEKTKSQLDYVVAPTDRNIFLKACAGSGKTEVVGLKAAYEIKQWNNKHSGIAFLSFTNDATNVIRERVKEFSNSEKIYPHFIGTLSSFIHGYIVQPFAYNIIEYNGKNRDFSLSIIDENTKVYQDHWLNHFKCKIPFISIKGNRNDIFANQIGYNIIKKDFYIKLNNSFYWLKDYYRKETVQSHINRKRSEYPEYWTESYFRKCFVECKKDFWKHGYVTFDDINILASKVLISEFGECIAKRFPLIIIDECQDLSDNELHVIHILKKLGCNIHFIGDLNQSIYEFKMVEPKNIEAFTSDFEQYTLDNNFRSCTEIVCLSNKLINRRTECRKSNDIFNDKSLIYVEYEKPIEAVEKYNRILKKLKCENWNNRILVKQNSLRKILVNNTNDEISSQEPLIVASQLWNEKTPNNMTLSLELAGKQISRWFGGGSSPKNYYRPDTISSTFAWRIYLMNILNEIGKDEKLSRLDVTYGEWHRQARERLNSILLKYYRILVYYDDIKDRNIDNLVNGNFRVSSGNSNKKIMNNEKPLSLKIPVLTIHGSKGCTFDTTLVISSSTKASDGGHWKEHWLMGNDEQKRIGYVAFTRAKYLLVLGLPVLSDKDRLIIESYNFVQGEKILDM